MLPTLFVSHGAPTLPIEPDSPARTFLTGLGASLPRPKAILAVSAHWETDRPAVSLADRPATLHDFHGFPPQLYQLRYPAPGAPDVALRALDLLEEAGIGCDMDPTRGLDHGAWVPLLLGYPKADIPVTQLSIQRHFNPEAHLALGEALAPLRKEGVLVLGSGGAIHNLRDLDWTGGDTPEKWAVEFEGWLVEAVARGDREALAHWTTRAPHAAKAQPRPDHFMPLLVALGAAGPGARGKLLHNSWVFGNLGMAAFAFDAA
ncbi:MAG TPA: class III extradiol ring-cleavage dioxygenase [Candidatus Thermoplasmatota archaeon]|nr:class III extradiol ring-cleavage dioxygenase [Candidatus Thermoplasmatota archaeon]